MNRKDFLKQLWSRVFKPLVILIVIFLSARFLISVFNEQGPERFITIAILTMVILFSLAYLAGEILRRLRDRLYSKLSASSKFRLRILGRITDYLAVLVLGAVLYKFWAEDALLASFFIVILLAGRITHIVREERSKAHNGTIQDQAGRV
jgi:uncharacterized membrane protein YhaH (DUF805 family)